MTNRIHRTVSLNTSNALNIIASHATHTTPTSINLNSRTTVKKTFSIALYLMFATSYYAQAVEPTTTGKTISYIGSFQFPGHTSEHPLPNVPVYYKGSHIPAQEGAYQKREYVMTDIKKLGELSIIVASKLKAPTANTIAQFEMPSDAHYIHYSLKRTPIIKDSEETFEETWAIQTHTGTGAVAIPNDSLVILVDPACIESIRSVAWQKEGNSLTLPTITFRKDLEKTSGYARSLLANLDVVPFHKKHEILESPKNKKSISSFRKS